MRPIIPLIEVAHQELLEEIIEDIVFRAEMFGEVDFDIDVSDYDPTEMLTEYDLEYITNEVEKRI